MAQADSISGHRAAPANAAPLTLRLSLWDDRPWCDVPERLRAVGVRLYEERGGGGAIPQSGGDELPHGWLIIRRWPTPVVLRRLETLSATTPVILCTAAPSVQCAQILNTGVADIVRADMHRTEILARLLLRCGTGGMGARAMAYGPLILDRVERMAWLNGRAVRLTMLQFDMLTVLVAAAGAVVARDRLRKAVWQNDHLHGTNRIAVHIHALRRALAEAGGGVGGGVGVVTAKGAGFALCLNPLLI